MSVKKRKGGDLLGEVEALKAKQVVPVEKPKKEKKGGKAA
jgi:hypothetical protein